MPRTTIGTDGHCYYRTKATGAAQAQAFARLLRGNSGRFHCVTVNACKRSGDKFFVQFAPLVTSRAAQTPYTREYAKNAERAALEGPDYIYIADPADSRRVNVYNPHSGETYEMFRGMCSCPHKTYRLEKAALHCKHELEFDERKAAGRDPFAMREETAPVSVPVLAGAALPQTLEDRFAKAGLRPDLDF